ncbi:MAG: Asp-tRNA(Asn)/Glu-tRNA(Gln) amidotransferase subunit GatC [Chloroflexota bacterium]
MLTTEEVRHVAMLARLGLSDEEVETMRAQLVQVLDYIAMLEKIDTSQIPPTAQILSHLNVTREDNARPSWPPAELLKGAPASEDGFFRVPAVLEEFKEGQNV